MSEYVADVDVRTWYDVVLAGAPCQPWSRANNNALGWADKRAMAFIHCCRLIRQALDYNPGCKFMMENVVVHQKLAEQGEEQEGMLGWPMPVVNAMHIGAPQSRPRRVGQNVTQRLATRKTPDPNLFLNVLGSWTEARVVPCVMAAGAETHAPVWVIDGITGGERRATLGGVEAL